MIIQNKCMECIKYNSANVWWIYYNLTIFIPCVDNFNNGSVKK